MVFNAKPLLDAEALVQKGDLARASDKLWEAVAQSLKAATGEWTAEGPRDMRRLLDRLFRQTGDRDLLRLYSVVESLRANAGEDFMSAEAVGAYAEDVRTLVEKLAGLSDSVGGQAGAPILHAPEEVLAARQQLFQKRTDGLSRRESRREVLAELARIEGQLENMKPSGRLERSVPGMPEARIAMALQRAQRQQEAEPAAQELGLYKNWLLGLMVNR
jgi:hypothetical protein